MAMSLLMARVIPDAFGDDGPYFAGAYFVFRFVADGVGVLNGDREAREAQWSFIPPTMVGSVLALAGGFIDSPRRAWIWLGSLAVDLVAALAAERVDWHTTVQLPLSSSLRTTANSSIPIPSAPASYYRDDHPIARE